MNTSGTAEGAHRGTSASLLSATELILRRQIQRSDSSPFISHIELDEERRKSLRTASKEFVKGLPELIARFIQCYPVAGLWVTVTSIAENYGQDGNAVYRWIADAYGVLDIPNQHRAELNRTFRKACNKFGLGVAGFRPSGYVDDYIFQAGVAHNQLSALVDAFVQAEAILGLPPDDDTRQLYAWQDQAADFAPWSLSRLRNILRQDEVAYHAQCYARARRGDFDRAGLEQRIASELVSATSRNSARRAALLAQPTLAFVDDALAIQAPPGVGIIATIGGRERKISGGGQLALGTPWPSAVSWRRLEEVSTGNPTGTLQILSGDRKLLAFDAETGRLLRTVTEGAKDSPTPVDAREAILIAAEPFEVGGEHSVLLGRLAYGLVVGITERMEIGIAGFRLMVAPPSRPLLDLELTKCGAGAWGPICGNPSSARVRFPGGRPDGTLELILEHASLSRSLAVVLPDGDDVSIDLSATLPRQGPAGPLRTSINMKSSGRALVKSSAWVWPGLEGLTDGTTFNAPALPDNIVLSECRHLTKDGNGRLTLLLDESYRSARIAFRYEPLKLALFEVLFPGITVALAGDQGNERFIPLGSTLSAGSDSTDSLLIRCPELNAALDVRGQVEPNAFGRTGVRRIAIAALSGQASSDEIRFLPPGRPEASRVLVSIAPTAAPKAFAVERLRPQRRVTVKVLFHTPLDAVKLAATDLASGESIEAASAFGRWEVDIPHRGIVQAVGGDVQNSAVVTINSGELPPGIWIGELLAGREDGRWMPLANARGDRYLLGLSANPQLSALPDDRLLFLRLTDAINRCVATECWSSYSAIVESLWQQVGKRLASTRDGRRALLEALGQPLPVDASPTWVPLRHPVELSPDLFSVEAEAFKSLTSDEIDGGAELGAISSTSGLQRLRDAFGNISLSFFRGFANFDQAVRTEAARLRDFSFRRFREAMKREESRTGVFWRPRDGRLSAAHHAWCIDRLVERVERVAPDGVGNNLQRMPHAAHLATVGLQIGSDLALATSEAVVERLSIAGAAPALFSVAAKAFRRGESAAFWNLITMRANRPQSELVRDFGFLTRIAPELFGFYLLLWELERRSFQ